MASQAPPRRESTLPDFDVEDTSSLNPQVCWKCANMITIATLEAGLDHQPELQALQASAGLGCPICSLLLNSLEPEADRQSGDTLSETGGSIRLVFDYLARPPFGRGPKDYSELIRVETKGFRGYLRVYSHPCKSRLYLLVSVNQTAHFPANKMATIITGRPIWVNKGVWRDVELIRDWIQECAAEHPDCCERGAMSQDLPLPTRVLDLGDLKHGKIRLHSPRGQKGIWIALSHRWGFQDMPKLTAENFELLHRSIALDSLPQAFRDTIHLAELLGVQYVWIDALCIIQDSPTDWDLDSSRMPGVYANSYFTVAAAASGDSSAGYLKHSCPEDTLKGFRIPLGVIDEIWVAPRIDNRVPQPRRAVPFARSALDTRAWCLQERILSPRFLSFLPREMTWTCRTHKRESTARLNGENGMHSMRLLQSSTLSQRLGHRHFDRAARTMIYWSWYREIVEDYTSRELTFASDKLVAVSGVAGLVQDRTGEEYLAGLWRKSLPRGLLWQAPHLLSGTTPDEAQARTVRAKLSEYRAPSWSWASLDGRVCFHDAVPDTAGPRVTIENNSVTFSLLEARTTPTGLNPLGQVEGGFLKVRGPMRRFIRGSKMSFQDGNGLDWNWEYDVPQLQLRPDRALSDGQCRIKRL